MRSEGNFPPSAPCHFAILDDDLARLNARRAQRLDRVGREALDAQARTRGLRPIKNDEDLAAAFPRGDFICKSGCLRWENREQAHREHCRYRKARSTPLARFANDQSHAYSPVHSSESSRTAELPSRKDRSPPDLAHCRKNRLYGSRTLTVPQLWANCCCRPAAARHQHLRRLDASSLAVGADRERAVMVVVTARGCPSRRPSSPPGKVLGVGVFPVRHKSFPLGDERETPARIGRQGFRRPPHAKPCLQLIVICDLGF